MHIQYPAASMLLVALWLVLVKVKDVLVLVVVVLERLDDEVLVKPELRMKGGSGRSRACTVTTA